MSFYLKLATANTLDLLSYVYLMLANAIQLVDKGSVGRSSSGVEIRGKGCQAEKS